MRAMNALGNKIKNMSYLKTTLTLAQKLQARYNNLNAPATQRIRNPFPMHQLVMETLNVMPNPDQVLSTTKKFSLTVNGETFAKTVPCSITVRKLLGDEFWNNKTFTMDEIKTKIIANGYRTTENNIASAISLLRKAGLVNDLCDPSQRRTTARFFRVEQSQ